MNEDIAQVPTTPAVQRPFKRLVSGSVIYSVGAVLVQLISIILLPFLTAYLSPREYGAVAVLNFASLSLVAVFSLGLSSSIGICYFGYHTSSERDRLIWSALGAIGVSVGAMAVIGLSAISLWPEILLGTDEFDGAAAYMLMATAATILALPMDAKLRLDERPKAFVVASLITTLAVGLLTLWFVIELQQGVQGYFSASLVGRLISLAGFYALAMRGTHLSVSKSMARSLVALGVPLIPQFAFLYILQYGNVEGIKRLVGLEAAGIYSAGLTVGLACNVVVSGIANAWAPFFLSYTNKHEEAADLFGDVTAYYIFGVGCMTLFFYYLSSPLILVLSSPEYHSAHTVVGPTATAMYMLGIYNLLLPPTYFAKEVSKLTYFLGAAAMMHLALGYVLISSFGIDGAAWSLIAAYGILDVLLYLWNRQQGERYFQIEYAWSRLRVFLLGYVISIILLTQLDLLSGWYYAFFCVAHFGVILAFIYLLLRRDEKAEIRRCLAEILRPLRPVSIEGRQ